MEGYTGVYPAFHAAGECVVNTCYKKICAVAVILGGAFLCRCAAFHTETTANPSVPEPAIRLPYGTAPLIIEHATPPPPPGSVPSIAPIEAQEGMARSLRLFQIDLGQIRTGPASMMETPDLSEDEP